MSETDNDIMRRVSSRPESEQEPIPEPTGKEIPCNPDSLEALAEQIVRVKPDPSGVRAILESVFRDGERQGKAAAESRVKELEGERDECPGCGEMEQLNPVDVDPESPWICWRCMWKLEHRERLEEVESLRERLERDHRFVVVMAHAFKNDNRPPTWAIEYADAVLAEIPQEAAQEEGDDS